MAETFNIKLDDIESWVKQETASIVEPLRKDAQKQLEDVRSKLEDLLDSSDKLLDDANKEIAKGSRKTYRRAKALYKLAESFNDLIEEIKFPEKISGETLNAASEQMGKTLKTIGTERAKWFRAISPYFIISRRRFDVTFKRANDSFEDFTEFMKEKYARAERAENVPARIDELREILANLSELEASKQKRAKQRAILEQKISQAQENLQTIKTKDEIVELTQLNKEIDELTKSIRSSLRHLEKPLLKFQTLVNSPGCNLLAAEVAKLDEYLNDPFKALATEKEGYPLLKVIVQKIDLALDNKKMKLKSSRLRKAKDQIKDILNKPILLDVQKRSIEVFSKKSALKNSGIISETKDERAELQNILKGLEIKRRLLDTKDAKLQDRYKDTQLNLDKLKRRLEKIVSELSGKDVQVLIN
jgi:chromosome segregation ATPase